MQDGSLPNNVTIASTMKQGMPQHKHFIETVEHQHKISTVHWVSHEELVPHPVEGNGAPSCYSPLSFLPSTSTISTSSLALPPQEDSIMVSRNMSGGSSSNPLGALAKIASSVVPSASTDPVPMPLPMAEYSSNVWFTDQVLENDV